MTLIQSAALVWLVSVAPLAQVLIPLLLPVLQQNLHLAPHEMSLLASADLTGGGLAAITAPLWLSRINCRQSILIGLVISVVANGLAAFAEAPTYLLSARLFSGLGTGFALSGAIPLLAFSAQPARLVSAVQVLQLLLAAVAMSGAGWLLPIGGTRDVLLVVITVTVLSAPLTLLIPDGRSTGEEHRLPTFADVRPALPALLSILLYFASVSVLTNYAGKLGTQGGLSIGFLSTALALGNLGALPGSLIAMLANDVTRQRRLLVAATILQCGGIAAIVWIHGALPFATAFFVLQVCMTIMAPVQVALLIDRDRSGRAIQALSAMQIVGQAIGPVSVAFAITGASVAGAYFWGALYVLVSAALIVLPARSATVTP